jgi:hypothetical protein
MTAGVLSNSRTLPLNDTDATIDCSPECGVWDEENHRCGLITQPIPRSHLGAP